MKVHIKRSLAVGATAVMAAGVALLSPTSAFAADPTPPIGLDPGALTLAPTSGAATDSLSDTTWTTSDACPAGAQGAAQVEIVVSPTSIVPFSFTKSGLGNAPFSGVLGTNTLVNWGDLFGDNGPIGFAANTPYEVVVDCATNALGLALTPKYEQSTWIEFSADQSTWQVVPAPGGSTGPVTTATTLTADPTTANVGDDVKLTASVSGDGAAGSVEFLDGSTSLGTDAVANGSASITLNTLGAGQHSITAKFTPTDPNAFAASTSSAVSVTINGGGGTPPGGSGSETVNVNIPQTGPGGGDLTLAVDGSPVSLDQVSGSSLDFQGALSPVTVSDTRDQLAGWTVTGQDGDFTGGANKIDGSALGWMPAVTTPNSAHDVTAGDAVAAGAPGLKGQPATWGSADAGKGAGDTVLGGTLDLQPPSGTAAGSYQGSLSVTLLSK